MKLSSITELQGCLLRGYEQAEEYSSKFEPFREFFAENEGLDLDKMQEEEHGEYN